MTEVEGSPAVPAEAARPSGRRIATLALLAIMAVTILVQVPRALRTLGDRASRSSSFSYDDRLFATGNGIIPNKDLLYEAAASIPARGSYRFVLGDRPVANAKPLMLYASLFATYYLMPRRPSPDAHWVLCLGCDPQTLGGHVTTVWSDQQGSSLLRVGG